jgi:hypothetical protein
MIQQVRCTIEILFISYKQFSESVMPSVSSFYNPSSKICDDNYDDLSSFLIEDLSHKTQNHIKEAIPFRDIAYDIFLILV